MVQKYTTGNPKPSFGEKLSRFFKRTVLASAALGTLGGAGYVGYNTITNYSEGTRLGTVTKFSEKGILCKTFEGEMMLPATSRINGQGEDFMFRFTVKDPAVVQKVEDAMLSGRRVAVEYQEALWVPTSCLQDTKYTIKDIKAVNANGRLSPYVVMQRRR